MTFIPEISLTEEMRLLLPTTWNQKLAKKRRQMWDCHIEQYTAIECGNNPVGATRINFVKNHLDILDIKFGTLLQFQALLAAAGSVVVTGLYKTGDYSIGFKRLVGGMVVLWVIDALLCLSGIRRLVWGDMGHFEPEPGTHITAEQVQVGAFRTEVIKRTAKFRVAVTVLVLMVALLPGMICGAVDKQIDFLTVELLLGGCGIALILVHRQHRERPFDEYNPSEGQQRAVPGTVNQLPIPEKTQT